LIECSIYYILIMRIQQNSLNFNFTHAEYRKKSINLSCLFSQ